MPTLHTQLKMGRVLYVNFILQTLVLLSEQGFHHHGSETLKVTIENNAFVVKVSSGQSSMAASLIASTKSS